MSDYIPTAFFEVNFTGLNTGMSGLFTSVSGLGMEFEYEMYSEGGRNYPVRFFKGAVQQTLVLEQGTVTTTDAFMNWIAEINRGIMHSLNGTVTLKDNTGEIKRIWDITDAVPIKYVAPSLDSMKSELAVTHMEFLYNGCF